MSEEIPSGMVAQSLDRQIGLAQSKWQLIFKRMLDLLIAIPVFVFLLPFFVLAALLIRVESPGPVFYTDRRLGKNGKVFTCIKFRTMFVDNDATLAAHLEANSTARQCWQLYRKLPDDPRVTRLGRLLRKFTIDEFPQVINIIRGEMSIVGPRPFMIREVPDIGPHLSELLTMRPGMAGMWIAYGRNRLTFEERVSLDLKYVREWSLKLDASLFFKSLVALLIARGAH